MHPSATIEQAELSEGWQVFCTPDGRYLPASRMVQDAKALAFKFSKRQIRQGPPNPEQTVVFADNEPEELKNFFRTFKHFDYPVLKVLNKKTRIWIPGFVLHKYNQMLICGVDATMYKQLADIYNKSAIGTRQ